VDYKAKAKRCDFFMRMQRNYATQFDELHVNEMSFSFSWRKYLNRESAANIWPEACTLYVVAMKWTKSLKFGRVVQE